MKTQTQGECHETTKAETGGYAATSQGMPKIAGKPPIARKRQGRILLYRFQRERGPADTLILDCQPPEL